ncbi:ATP-dependent nuclease [Paenibacillus odorifer]|uniref:ATP-dependent nuclease n=1 Tax=Paenibacillus odorifer TaxID=189426 RepID=UPI00289B66B3|nr:AAA family ATPase [Paenibacillus odorifer]
MEILKVHVQNYRNIKDINIELNRLVIFIGENNSGKSNLLRAITLPFYNDEVGAVNKNLVWSDINKEAKKIYFDFIEKNMQAFKDKSILIADFTKVIPSVSVQAYFSPEKGEEYYVKNWITSLDENEAKANYSIKYVFSVTKPNDLLEHVTRILEDEDSIEHIKMNLLPIEFYSYIIIVPQTGVAVSVNDLNGFKYNSLAAERDEFSNKTTQLGSKALVNLLNSKLTKEQKISIEKSYESFFDQLKGISNLEGIFNWQNTSDLENAKTLFQEISLLPNMPSMSSLLNNVRLGYGEEYLHTHGLGYRNLIYLLVMINSLESNQDIILNLLTVEEPEAHLCVSNERLLTSYINSVIDKSKNTQLFISTHSAEILNKLELHNVVIVAEGAAFSLKSQLDKTELDYLAKKPNLDFLKFLFSRNCILVEGPTEEMLIKSYLAYNKKALNDIVVISLHKGFSRMIKLWLKVNLNIFHRLGIVRDFDNQQKALEDHEAFNKYHNVCVTTTRSYTLETEFVAEDGNYNVLKAYFEAYHGWTDIETPEQLSDRWRSAKTDVMLKFCQDIGVEELKGIKMPRHIDELLEFFKTGVKK